MSLTPPERETIVRTDDDDNSVRIWTCQRRYLSRLRKDDRFMLVGEGNFQGTEWAEFTIPSSDWNPVSGAKRRISPEAGRKMAERLNAAQ